MTNDEMQKTMEFILERQAQFAVNIQRLQEEQLRDIPRLARLEDSFQLLVQLAETTDTRLDTLESNTVKLESNTVKLESNSVRLEANMVKLEANMAVLAETQAHSDARLSALMDIVREGHNGKS
jgi:flagellar basal body rod protein FlgB